jgi:light-regulated signal transduction histidine kinase (bacteriophytochrome)
MLLPVKDKIGKIPEVPDHLRELTPDDSSPAKGTKNESSELLSQKVLGLLANIIGFSELLLRKENINIPPENREYLNYIRETSLRLEGLLGEVLGKPQESGKISETIAVGDLVTACRNKVEDEAEVAGVKMEVELAPGADTVLVPEALLAETISGLLSLVIKNTAEGEKVGLRCSLTNNSVLFTVWRTFSPGWQAREIVSSKSGETGFENEKVLMLIRDLSKGCGGRFWVEGTLGEVSSYCLLLPAVEKTFYAVE